MNLQFSCFVSWCVLPKNSRADETEAHKLQKCEENEKKRRKNDKADVKSAS